MKILKIYNSNYSEIELYLNKDKIPTLKISYEIYPIDHDPKVFEFDDVEDLKYLIKGLRVLLKNEMIKSI